MAKALMVEVGSGELIDKITILQIKIERLKDPQKLLNVQHELEVLCAVHDAGLSQSKALVELVEQLREVNATLWQLEDDIRVGEAAQDFGAGFVAAARAIYHFNDRRAALKRAINHLTGATIIEEKGYAGSE